MIFAQTERLIIRSWKAEDIPLFKQMNKDNEVMKYFPALLSDAETETFYERISLEFQQKGYGLYAIELKATKEFIGYVGLHQIGFKSDVVSGTEIGWRLASKFHKCGYAPEAATAVITLAREIGIKELYSFTAKINKPSERVMQKIGMTKVCEFNIPTLAADSILNPHVLYKITL